MHRGNSLLDAWLGDREDAGYVCIYIKETEKLERVTGSSDGILKELNEDFNTWQEIRECSPAIRQ